jgi:hypothetical protein
LPTTKQTTIRLLLQYVDTLDYDGLNASFTPGVISGQATLELIRDILSSRSFSVIFSTASLATWGALLPPSRLSNHNTSN